MQIKTNFDPNDLGTEDLEEIFVEVARELGYRGQWKVDLTRAKFIAHLTKADLANWAESLVKEAAYQGVGVPLVKASPTPAIATQLNETEQALAETGRVIPAIKAYRTRMSGLSLKEAKDAVDAWATNVRTRRAEQIARTVTGPLETVVF
jgi:ribosomal protein L7/L12